MLVIILSSCAVIIMLFIYINNFRRVKSVVCWFCSSKCKVQANNTNSWVCPACSQYNGFQKDGDYNKTISAFHEESLNPNVYCRRGPMNSVSNGLCDSCNLNQQVLIKLVSEFEPFNDDNFEHEFKQYKKELENMYSLCSKCRMHVANVLLSKSQENPMADADMNSETSSSALTVNRLQKFLIHTLEISTFIGALSLLFLNLCELELDSHAYSLTGLPETIMNKAKTYLSYRTHIAFAGFASSTVASLLTGHHALSGADLLTTTTWAICQLLQDGQVEAVIEKSDVFLMRPILNGLIICLLLNNVIYRWTHLEVESSKKINSKFTGRSLTFSPKSQSRNTEVLSPPSTARISVPKILITEEKEERNIIAPLNNKIDNLSLSWEDDAASTRSSCSRVSINHLSNVKGLYEPRSYPNDSKQLIKPARFTAGDSVATTSWVAGGIWTKKAVKQSNSNYVAGCGSTASSFITPPPSECDSRIGAEQNFREDAIFVKRDAQYSEPISSGFVKHHCDHCVYRGSTFKSVIYNLIMTTGLVLTLFILFTGVILLTTSTFSSENKVCSVILTDLPPVSAHM
ncbi:Transmembrane protein [Halotydeus destructor]|nr:Transmembrane protein [Halotydeus destructor]